MSVLFLSVRKLLTLARHHFQLHLKKKRDIVKGKVTQAERHR
jgi:hypothetical protein